MKRSINGSSYCIIIIWPLLPASFSRHEHTTLATGSVFVRILICKTLDLILKQFKKKGECIGLANWDTQGGTGLRDSELGSLWFSLHVPSPETGWPSFMECVCRQGEWVFCGQRTF